MEYVATPWPVKPENLVTVRLTFANEVQLVNESCISFWGRCIGYIVGNFETGYLLKTEFDPVVTEAHKAAMLAVEQARLATKEANALLQAAEEEELEEATVSLVAAQAEEVNAKAELQKYKIDIEAEVSLETGDSLITMPAGLVLDVTNFPRVYINLSVEPLPDGCTYEITDDPLSDESIAAKKAALQAQIDAL